MKYCNVECQRAHWKPVHKLHCRPVAAVAPRSAFVTDVPLRPPCVDAIALLPELGLELRATRSRGGHHSSLALYTTVARRAGELVLRETSDLMGTLATLVPRIHASPALAALMMPREGTIKFLDTGAQAEYAELCKSNQTLPADAVASIYCKLRTNTWALPKGDGVWRAPGATTDDGKSEQTVFALAQFMDNACRPNIGQLVHRNAMCADYRGYAMQDIAAGEKICHSYVFEQLPRAARHKQLEFNCECDQCLSGPEPPPRSVWPLCVAPIAAESLATGQTLDLEWTRTMASERHVARFPDLKESQSVPDAAIVFADAWRDGRLQALDFAGVDRVASRALELALADIELRTANGESTETLMADLHKLEASRAERK